MAFRVGNKTVKKNYKWNCYRYVTNFRYSFEPPMLLPMNNFLEEQKLGLNFLNIYKLFYGSKQLVSRQLLSCGSDHFFKVSCEQTYSAS